MEMKQCAGLREFNRLYKEISSLYYEVSVKAGVSDSAFWIMYAIVELGDGCLQKDIAETYSISKQTVSSSVRSLEKRGCIALKHGKGRNMHLLLTEKGKAFVQQKILPLMEVENKVFEVLTLEESKELIRISQKYNEIFREEIAALLKRGDPPS